MKPESLNVPQSVDLLYQALETEKGGVQIYSHTRLDSGIVDRDARDARAAAATRGKRPT